MTWFGNFFKKIVGDDNPNKVLEVKTVEYDDRQIIHREEGMFLYSGHGELKYDIVLHKPFSESMSTGFSLFRSTERHLAEEKFLILKDKLPVLLSLTNADLFQIQKYCSAMEEHPSWNVCHLAVHFNLAEVLSSPLVTSLINSPCPLTGLSPLLLAVQLANLTMVDLLVAHKADLNHLDHQANSVYHFAAAAGKDAVLAVARGDGSLRCLSQRNVDGHTPLHVACMADKPDAVIALISKGADVNVSAGTSRTTPGQQPVGLVPDILTDARKQFLFDEIKFGGTPLHWASSRQVIVALCQRDCDVNALNFASETALHVMVRRNQLECVAALLSHTADITIGDSNGNTALHLAASQKFLPLVQALVVFGADLNCLNNRRESARHIAALGEDQASHGLLNALHVVGAVRCAVGLDSCTAGCSPTGTFDGIPPIPIPARSPSLPQTVFEQEVLTMSCQEGTRGGRVLSLDGGGIRGLVIAVNLLHLETALSRPLMSCFDWVAATSTGGLFALTLASGNTVRESMCMYFRMKDVIFEGARPYNSETLESMIQAELGFDTKMCDIQHPKIMITSCLADRIPLDLHLFRNYESPQSILSTALEVPVGTGPKFDACSCHTEQKIWEAARATAAAPTFFRPYKQFVDGGLIANNPTMDALTEIHELNTALLLTGKEERVARPKLIVSIGTGSVPLTQRESPDIYWPTGLLNTRKILSSLSMMSTILIDQATLADGRIVDRSRAFCSMLGIPYFRFSPTLSEEIQMDERSDLKLIQMMWAAKVSIVAQSAYVDKLVSILVRPT